MLGTDGEYSAGHQRQSLTVPLEKWETSAVKYIIGKSIKNTSYLT